MESRQLTIIIDLDGTLLYHFGSLEQQMRRPPKILPGVKEKFDEWDKKGYKIIILTGRKESMRKITEEQLEECCIVYDQLVMGVGGGKRILINDFKTSSSEPTASSITVERNKGIGQLEI